MTDFSPTSSKYTRSVWVCGGIREHDAIVLMGNFTYAFRENGNGVLWDDCKCT